MNNDGATIKSAVLMTIKNFNFTATKLLIILHQQETCTKVPFHYTHDILNIKS